jgi:site-specific DNA recombinase
MFVDKYVVAIYLRLSIDDKKVESMSIDSQRKLLTEYADNLGIDNIEIIEFVDNGYSGTNFERPAVQELLAQVKAFKINCIMVKDFSRFGRNSLEVGYFTQQVFPLFNVRFISVSDDFDSYDYKGDTGGLGVAFKYLVNEYYSRDLSQKSKTAKYMKMRRGEYNSGTYCYGYKKGDNGEMVIDEAVADNVRLIFKLASQGKSSYEISKELFNRKILTPAQYKAQNGKKGYDISSCKYWVGTTILRMLENEQYTGMFVMCKQTVREVGSTLMRKRDESEWIKISNHHPAIISKELFDKVQKTKLTFKQPHKKTRNYILKSKVFCGCCNHAMDYLNKKSPEYICYYTKIDETEPCYRMTIEEAELHKVIFSIISKQAQVIVNIDNLTDLNKLQIQTEHTIELEDQINSYHEKKQRLYEQLLMREISLNEYRAKKDTLDGKLQAVQRLYNRSCKQVEIIKIDNKTKSQILHMAKDVLKESTLTQTLADALVKRVYIYPNKNIEIVWKILDFCHDFS